MWPQLEYDSDLDSGHVFVLGFYMYMYTLSLSIQLAGSMPMVLLHICI